jgi:hypothetical protein
MNSVVKEANGGARSDFACEIKGAAMYLALRRHNVILVIPSEHERIRAKSGAPERQVA